MKLLPVWPKVILCVFFIVFSVNTRATSFGTLTQEDLLNYPAVSGYMMYYPDSKELTENYAIPPRLSNAEENAQQACKSYGFKRAVTYTVTNADLPLQMRVTNKAEMIQFHKAIYAAIARGENFSNYEKKNPALIRISAMTDVPQDPSFPAWNGYKSAISFSELDELLQDRNRFITAIEGTYTFSIFSSLSCEGDN